MKMPSERKRLTLGMLVSDLDRADQGTLWSAASRYAQEAAINLYCFVGSHHGSAPEMPDAAQSRRLYDWIAPQQVDGLIVLSSMADDRISVESVRALCRRFDPQPVVSVGVVLEGVPSVVIDSAPGMHAVMEHLIDVHGYRRIAFIRGPEGHTEAERRYRVYREALAEHGLVFDPALVVPGDLVTSVPEFRSLLDTPGLQPDAVVTTNYAMACSAIAELRACGLHVPGDIAVASFEDGPDRGLTVPFLTTVSQPTAEMARQAIAMALAWVREEAPKCDVILESELVVRRSCGCSDPVIEQATVGELIVENHEADVEQFGVGMQDLGRDLIAASDIDQIVGAIRLRLPQLGIPSCYLVLHQPASEPTSATIGKAPFSSAFPGSRLQLAYRDHQSLLLSQDEAASRFQTQDLLPSQFLPQNRAHNLVIMPLAPEHRLLGYVLFEPGPYDGACYTTLWEYLSRALQGVVQAEAIRRRASCLQIATEVSRVASGQLDQKTLLERVVELLCERLALTYVGIFLVDEQGTITGEPGRWAVLHAVSGEAGREKMAQRHRLHVGATSTVGRAIADRVPHISQDITAEEMQQAHGLQPEIRSEMVLPIISRVDEVLGALTLQSDRAGAFTASDAAAMQPIADQLASALENVRLMERTQSALRDLEATQRRYQQRAWSEYLASLRDAEYQVAREGLAPLSEDALAEIEQALETRRPTVLKHDGGETTEDSSALVVPITYRSGAVMGALGIHDDPDRQWRDDEVALIAAVVERMGLAAENLRLLDETQQRVATELLTQEITARMRESLDVERVLRAAVEGLVDAFDVAEVNLRLVAPTTPQTNEEEVQGERDA